MGHKAGRRVEACIGGFVLAEEVGGGVGPGFVVGGVGAGGEVDVRSAGGGLRQLLAEYVMI